MERFHLLVSIVVFGGFFCNGQMIERDEGILIMKNIFDQNEEILEHLKGQQEKITSLEDMQKTMMLKFQEQQENFTTLEEMQRTIEDTLRDQHTENQLCAKQDQLEDFKNTYESGTEEFKASLEQLLDFQGMLAKGIHCESPSLRLDGLGCITLIQTGMNWTEARAECNRLGLRLLEDLKVEHLSPLDLHFTPLRTGYTQDSWIGFRDKIWVTSGHSVASELLAVGEGELDGGCGSFDIRRDTTSFGLYDMGCTDFYDALCQTIP